MYHPNRYIAFFTVKIKFTVFYVSIKKPSQVDVDVKAERRL